MDDTDIIIPLQTIFIANLQIIQGGGVTHLEPDSMDTMCNPLDFQTRPSPPPVSTYNTN